MKRATIILIVILISVGMLGTLMYREGAGHSSCIASAVQGYACPEGAGLLGIANFHIKAFHVFSLALLAAAVFALFFIKSFFQNEIERKKSYLLVRTYGKRNLWNQTILSSEEQAYAWHIARERVPEVE
ncbi:hypothetical protein A3A21_02070 [Candidatus Jorgensenbacteria bacterium RIFCSPLOWO2_01_FULL_45_25b]|uniref:Uncharacterized protein n=1 Tax=Candidatus Jorgensenbacteria bacterium RIFCSPLOWO2_01_FULL_45_25b TaxID=1798471 RepID=A0A1F6BZ97_9BACT|nr:MAG: hypothetical protein A3A21_02070 [Candidatus Jorgensenbacteria bacterium RIFCSPLOWO2_01_FULL_45_25b]